MKRVYMRNVIYNTDAYELTECEHANLVLMDPVYGQPEVNRALDLAMSHRASGGAIVCFMYPEDVMGLKHKPDQILHWVKPISTKNTVRRYSRFVEAIAVWHGRTFNQDMHWSCRTGVFTDTLGQKHAHPWRKPYSLIEKLVLLHTNPGDLVFDPFAGTCVTHDVCVDNGRASVCVEKDYRWVSGKSNVP